MTVVTVPLTSELEKFINDQIELENFETKTQVIRAALRKFKEDYIVEEILKASREAKAGTVLRGDLKEIVKKFRD